MAILSPVSSFSKEPLFCSPSFRPKNPKTLSITAHTIFDSDGKFGRTEQTHLRLWTAPKSSDLKLNASMDSPVPTSTRELKTDKLRKPPVTKTDTDFFDELKQRFTNFKNHKYMQNLEHFENLAKSQAPKFMVISCADSRVCPSNVLGFQPGEAFVVRNVANMVPLYENGPSETNAALEFAVNSLKVENILVIGHSCCGGIRALMSMHDDVKTSSFIGSWVSVGMIARSRTKAAASNLSFDRQCRHCEKESINCSLANLLTYPWIEEKVRDGELSIHGGYYDFVDCTFEKWTLDYEASELKEQNGKIAVKDKTFWC